MKHTLTNGRIINIPDKDLENLQKILEISKDEAIHTWLVDNDYEIDETVEELTEKAKKNKVTNSIHGAKATKSGTKSTKPREKKENPLKRDIIRMIFETLSDERSGLECVTISNAEKYIDFSVDGVEFTVNLVQHRAKK